MIEYQLPCRIMYNSISANHDKVEGHSTNGEILIKRFETLNKIRI